MEDILSKQLFLIYHALWRVSHVLNRNLNWWQIFSAEAVIDRLFTWTVAPCDFKAP